MNIDWPLKKYRLRRVPALAAGSVKRAPGGMRSVQIATSPLTRVAHESGGGFKAFMGLSVLVSRPAMTDT